ncbi:unnamed protein product [Arabidopsis halleri]
MPSWLCSSNHFCLSSSDTLTQTHLLLAFVCTMYKLN